MRTLRGGDFLKRNFGCDLVLASHDGTAAEKITLAGYEDQHGGHMGGDEGLVGRLYTEMREVRPEDMRSGISRSVESHFMAFAAERSRVEGRIVELEELYRGTGQSGLPASPRPA